LKSEKCPPDSNVNEMIFTSFLATSLNARQKKDGEKGERRGREKRERREGKRERRRQKVCVCQRKKEKRKERLKEETFRVRCKER
jgi:hypothetical protein